MGLFKSKKITSATLDLEAKMALTIIIKKKKIQFLKKLSLIDIGIILCSLMNLLYLDDEWL